MILCLPLADCLIWLAGNCDRGGWNGVNSS